MVMARLSMRKCREALRLAFEAGLKAREIGRSLSISHPTVLTYLSRAKAQGLTWPLPEGLDDLSLERLLSQPKAAASCPRPQPDFALIQKELKRKGVTLQLLWQEYLEIHPGGYGRSQFCKLYGDFAKTLDLTLRQDHKAGEKLFVDFAGQSISLIDPHTGETHPAQIFVAVLGASNYTYAEATLCQDLPSWILAHVHAFEFFNGVAAALVPDNLRAAVSRSCIYEPAVNATYAELARHYGTVILPARARRPRDKEMVSYCTSYR